MIKVIVQGLQEAQKELDKQQKQVPFATALALTRTAGLAKKAIESEMRTVFDRPTRWTLNSLRLFPAKKNKLEARVWMKNEADKSVPATRWLNPQIDGGQRQDKRTETLLRQKGILPAGKYVVPGSGAKLNANGNISRGQIQKILSGLGAQNDRYQNSTNSRRSAANKRSFFVIGKGGSAAGIAQRSGSSVKMMLAFVSRPRYRRRLDFFGIGNKVAADNLDRELVKAMRAALATAR
jgi:hypothetical protein